MENSHELRHEFIVATKELVDHLIENLITRNRRLVKKRVDGYARDMELGRWMMSDSSICVSASGKTLNGMHRLHALRKQGYPPIMLSIKYGLTDESIKVMDSGLPRSVADVMTIDGKNVSRKVVAACAVYMRECDPTFLSLRPTAVDVTNVLDGLKESFDYLNQVDGFHKLKAPVMAAFVAEHKSNQNEKILDFCKSYLTGAMLSHDSPILALRECLNQTRPLAKGFKEQRVDFYLTSTAIKSYIDGEPLTQKSLKSRLKRKMKNQVKRVSVSNKALV